MLDQFFRGKKMRFEQVLQTKVAKPEGVYRITGVLSSGGSLRKYSGRGGGKIHTVNTLWQSFLP